MTFTTAHKVDSSVSVGGGSLPHMPLTVVLSLESADGILNYAVLSIENSDTDKTNQSLTVPCRGNCKLYLSNIFRKLDCQDFKMITRLEFNIHVL